MEPEADVNQGGAAEAVNPMLQIFPPEVWGMVLDKIEDPKDRVNAANSNPLFREHFQSKLNQESWTFTLLGMVLPQLYDYLPGSDLLTLRQVSKVCKRTVDNFLESGDMWKLMNGVEDEKRRIMVDLGKYCPIFGEKLIQYNKFVNQLRTLPQAKMVGGTVRVKESGFLSLGPFFQEFGTQVYHLQLIVLRTPAMDVVRYTRNLLRNMSNLKTLTISLNFEYCDHDIQRQNIVRFLEDNPLPDLPNLVSLWIKASSNPNDPAVEFFREMLVKYGAQLQNLKLSEIWIMLPSPMLLLTNLSLYLGDHGPGPRLGVRNPVEMEILQSLTNLRAPLEKIELEFDYRVEACLVELFRILETYKDSLKHLSLTYEKPTWLTFHASPPFPSKINLPCLEELEVVNYRMLRNTSFDFLVSFPRLKCLKLKARDWTCNEVYEDASAPRTEYNADNDKLRITKSLMEREDGNFLEEDAKMMLYLSPIWKELRFLDSMTFRKGSYRRRQNIFNRKDYEYYQDKLAKMSFY